MCSKHSSVNHFDDKQNLSVQEIRIDLYLVQFVVEQKEPHLNTFMCLKDDYSFNSHF